MPGSNRAGRCSPRRPCPTIGALARRRGRCPSPARLPAGPSRSRDRGPVRSPGAGEAVAGSKGVQGRAADFAACQDIGLGWIHGRLDSYHRSPGAGGPARSPQRVHRLVRPTASPARHPRPRRLFPGRPGGADPRGSGGLLRQRGQPGGLLRVLAVLAGARLAGGPASAGHAGGRFRGRGGARHPPGPAPGPGAPGAGAAFGAPGPGRLLQRVRPPGGPVPGPGPGDPADGRAPGSGLSADLQGPG